MIRIDNFKFHEDFEGHTVLPREHKAVMACLACGGRAWRPVIATTS